MAARVTVNLLSIVLLCGLLGFARSGAALDPHKRLTQYVHSTWSVEAGLPSASVTALLQTADGYLWIGTNNGLSRFDGLRFAVFDRRSTPELRSSSISALVQDAAGDLWIGTLGGGVVRYRDGRFQPVGVADARIVTLKLTPDGDLWAGGYGGLTRIRNGNVVRQYGAAEGLVGDPVLALESGQDGQLLVATATRLHRLTGQALEVFQPAAELPVAALRDIFRLRDGSVILRSPQGELVRQTDTGFERWVPRGVPQHVAVRWLLQDRDDNLWLGTEQHGLYRVSAGGVDHFGENEGFTGGRVRIMVEDRDGSLWLGAFDSGLHRFRDGLFTTWGKPEGFASNTIYSVFEDHAANVWVGTNNGLMRIQGDQVRRYTSADGLASDSIRALYESPAADALWIGTVAGLHRMQDDRVTQALTTADGLPGNAIVGTLLDRHGSLWIAIGGAGLARYAEGKVVVLTHAEGLADDFVYALHEARDGVLWVGTANGLTTLRDDRITRDAGAPVNAITGPVTAFHEDERGVMWIGTEGSGLYRWAQGKLTPFTEASGFPDDSVYCILADAQQRFWFSSYRGVFSIERAQLDAVAAGERPRVDAVRYGLLDGMRSLEGNGGQQPPGWRGRDGRLWFSTMGGVSVVDPARIVAAGKAPRVEIESLLADDRLVDARVPIRLPAGTRRLEFRYTAPSLATPERTQFRLRLEGFDTRWNDVGLRRVANFTNLERGDYRLRVAASNQAGQWGAQEGVLAFSIAPYFYQTWWFKGLLTLAALAILASFYQLRLAWLEAQNAVLRERQRIAGEIHDNLAQSFSGVIHQAEAAMCRFDSDPRAAARHMETVCELATHGADAARHSMWELGATRAGTDSLLQAITSAARRLTQGRELRLKIDGGGAAWRLPPQMEHEVLCIAQAAIANAVEHAACSEITVRLTYTRRALTLLVQDDGIGFDPAQAVKGKGRGFGLENLRHRAQAVRGRLDIRSARGEGTIVQLVISRRQWTWYLRRSLSAALRRRAGRGPTRQDPDPVG